MEQAYQIFLNFSTIFWAMLKILFLSHPLLTALVLLSLLSARLKARS